MQVQGLGKPDRKRLLNLPQDTKMSGEVLLLLLWNKLCVKRFQAGVSSKG